MSASAAIEALALFTPAVASCAAFAPRRLSKGMKAIDEDNTAYGILNFDIAAGQTLKGLRAASALSVATGMSAASSIENMRNGVKALSNNNKLLKGLGTVVKVTSENVNPIIIAASGVRVLTADDKIDAFDREAINLSFMFGAEALAKRTLGMPELANDPTTGNMVAKRKKSLLGETTVGTRINNLFGETQKAATNDLKQTKMFFDKIPAKAIKGGLKGAFFVTASILGYKLGECVSDKLLGEEKTKKAKA